jgi:pantoate--beta-alanine ligase
MKVLAAAAGVQALALGTRAAGRSIGLVPTMGALHEGHLGLVRAARRDTDLVVVSLFVNPTQFGLREDLARYPRDFEGDRRKLQDEGVDVLWAPPTEEVYPAGYQTYIRVEELETRLDGASRPGHFRGVATVVAKLFHVVLPHRAYFGQKDAAQVAVIRRMVRDLNFPLELVVCPIVREPDGLALSSRNAYLGPEDRQAATILYRSLQAAQARYDQGERSAAALRLILFETIASEPRARLDYAEVVDPDSLLPVDQVSSATLLAVAAWLGATRLIDNVVVGKPVV